MNKQPSKTAQTKENIIDAFWYFYKTKDSKNISVTEVIKKAGYNRATFYRYFDDTQSILDCIEYQIINTFNEIILKNSLLKEFNKSLFNNFLELHEMYGEYFSVLIGENGDPHFITKFKDVIKPTFYSLLDSDYQNNIRADILFEFICSGLFGAFSYWSANKDLIDEDELFEFTDHLINNGTLITLNKYFNM